MKRGASPDEENASNDHTVHLRLQCVWTPQPSSANAGERGASPNEGWRVLAREAQAPNQETPWILKRFPYSAVQIKHSSTHKGSASKRGVGPRR